MCIRDRIRAFCIVTSVSITVLFASLLGLPVSTTHITVGAIFGIALLRERLKLNYALLQEEIRDLLKDQDAQAIEDFLTRFNQSSPKDKSRMLKELDRSQGAKRDSLRPRKHPQKLSRQVLVERSTLIRILGAWFVTLPVTGLLAALAYQLLALFI